MQEITLEWSRLFRYSLFFLIYSFFMTVFFIIWFSVSLEAAWNKILVLTFAEIEMSFFLSFSLFIFLTFPLLMLRFLFYFSKMLYSGRRPGVSLITYKTLFNPINFLFFRSLLNKQGAICRIRCISSMTLMIALYLSIYLVI